MNETWESWARRFWNAVWGLLKKHWQTEREYEDRNKSRRDEGRKWLGDFLGIKKGTINKGFNKGELSHKSLVAAMLALGLDWSELPAFDEEQRQRDKKMIETLSNLASQPTPDETDPCALERPELTVLRRLYLAGYFCVGDKQRRQEIRNKLANGNPALSRWYGTVAETRGQLFIRALMNPTCDHQLQERMLAYTAGNPNSVARDVRKALQNPASAECQFFSDLDKRVHEWTGTPPDELAKHWQVQSGRGPGLARIVISIVALCVIVAIFVFLPGETKSQPRGTVKILSPLPGETVGKEVHVRIEGLENIQPGDEVHLFEEVGKLLWPKKGRYQGRASQDVTVDFGGPRGDTKIVLGVVGPTGQAHIQRWFEESERSGNYFGIPLGEFTDLIVLDVVPVKQTE